MAGGFYYRVCEWAYRPKIIEKSRRQLLRYHFYSTVSKVLVAKGTDKEPLVATLLFVYDRCGFYRIG